MTNPLVLSETREPGIGLITLNKPDRLNAWSDAMNAAFFTAFDGFAADRDVRAIVITGAGRGFCAGADMAALSSIVTPREERSSGRGADDPGGTVARGRPITDVFDCSKPVIAAVNGACAGMGMSLALLCDVRFAAAGAKFTTAFSRRGLVAEWGMSWALSHLAGTARALDLLMTGRVVLAEEAERMGIVNFVADPDVLLEKALAYTEDMIRHSSPTSWAVMKRQVRGDQQRSPHEAFEAATKEMAASFSRGDLAEGVKSYLEKREPQFPPYRG